MILLVAATQATSQTLRSTKIFGPEEDERESLATVRVASKFDVRQVSETARNVAQDQGKQRDVLILVPTIPVTFNSLEKDSVTDKWRIGPAIAGGVGATFVLGKATYQGEMATVQPWIIAGGAINAGVKEDADRSVTEALTVSGFFGFGNVALSFSRNLLRGGTSIGLSLKTDALTNMAPDAFACFRGCNPVRSESAQRP